MFADTLSLPARAATTLRATAAVPPEGLASLFGRQVVESFEPGAVVVWQGDAADQVFEVTEGVLRIVTVLSDGRRVITGFAHAGDLMGLALRNRQPYTAEAVTAVKLRRIGRRRFQDEADRSPELRAELFARMCEEMAAAQDQMVLLGRKTAEERVCSFLLRMQRRLARAGAMIELPMTRVDMADYLGLTMETVSRIMTRLAARGVIEARGRHGVVVRQPETLAALAGESDEDEADGCRHRAVWPQ